MVSLRSHSYHVAPQDAYLRSRQINEAYRQALSTTRLAVGTVVDSEPEFYVPDVWRKKADDVKQGSSDEAVESMVFGISECHPKEGYGTLLDYVAASYQDMLEAGVAPEQARMVLPQSTMYTEVIATGNLYCLG